ncbi:hypothetical protein RB601_000236 [Gaeumannomyces tritici]
MSILSWGTIKSLIIVFGPFFLPKIISFYRRVRHAPTQPGRQPIRPLPPAASRALVLLAAVSIAFLVKSLPLPGLAPENVFVATDSRLQIPTDVLFNRLASLRPDGALTARDESLRARFVNLESRLLYLAYGPAALADCAFCSSDEPSSYLCYALVDVAAAHLLNVALLALATSRGLAGRDGRPWRGKAILASAVLAALDAYLLTSHDHQANARALRLADLDFFHWRTRAYRYASFALLDAGFAAVLFLSATRRAFASPRPLAERVDSINKNLAAGVRSRLGAAAIVKNAVSRDAELMRRAQAYWAHEIAVMGGALEDREVVEGIKDAMESRIDMKAISADAEKYAKAMLESVGGNEE